MTRSLISSRTEFAAPAKQAPTARISRTVVAVPFGMIRPVCGLGGLGSRPRSASMSRLTAPSTAGRITIRARKPLSDAITET
jgi:hypothetical protein